MSIPQEDDIITNADESRKLPDENPEPLEGTKKEESNLLEAEPTSEKPPVEKPKPETGETQKKEAK